MKKEPPGIQELISVLFLSYGPAEQLAPSVIKRGTLGNGVSCMINKSKTTSDMKVYPDVSEDV